MELEEQKWPATNLMPSPANLLATETACLGSQASSPIDSSIFCPITPPLALRSATANSAPSFNCLPKLAYSPVIGPAAAILTCALAGTAARARTAATAAAPANRVGLFIVCVSPRVLDRGDRRAADLHPKRNRCLLEAPIC